MLAVEGIADSSGAFCMTGGPGVGKTTTLRAAVERLVLQGKRFLLLAPTGKAALRIMQQTGHTATTIHRVLWSPDVVAKLAGIDVVLIDEASMVDTQTLGELATLLTLHSDARLVLVGDPNQLPPVGPGMPFEDILRSEVVPRVNLKTVYRQKGDSWVVDNAYRILAGEMIDLRPTHDFSFVESKQITNDAMRYLAAKFAEDAHPASYQILSPQRKEQDNWDTGATTQRINKTVQERTQSLGDGGKFSLPWGEVYRVGDRVIQTRNNYTANVVNGQMGTVMYADDEGLRVRFDGEDGELTYSDIATSDERGKPPPSPRELDLAFAVTVHKSQGSEWKEVCIIADPCHKRMLQRRLFYTAITRASEKLTIIGTEEAVVTAVKANQIEQRNTLLRQKLTGEEALYGTACFETRP